ncbi:hypothetical protein GCM10010530_59180 [Kribbella aluminosa]
MSLYDTRVLGLGTTTREVNDSMKNPQRRTGILALSVSLLTAGAIVAASRGRTGRPGLTAPEMQGCGINTPERA